jgi:hypothetical protein
MGHGKIGQLLVGILLALTAPKLSPARGTANSQAFQEETAAIPMRMLYD